MDMTPLYTPQSTSEATVIAALLDAHDIRYIMQGAAFSSMYPGPFSTSLNECTLLVANEHIEFARQLLGPFMQDAS
jgi:hypothetical protein